ncbi:MAG: DNA primase [Firmicutes bacterium]|nr:DNA primase [Bacillota bacterium]
MSLRITDELKEEIRSRNRLEDVVGTYVTLKRSGKSLTGLCPFHNERTPSFSVSPDKQLYYCFGCGASGDVFDFVMEYERLDFMEAAKRLAERAGIVLDTGDESSSERKRRQERETLYEVNGIAAKYFRYRLLKSRLAAAARNYLSSRGVSSESSERFLLGYAMDSWDDLYRVLQKRGISEDGMVLSGLVKKGKKSAYDVFRDRIMFPIRDASGRVLGFGGRALPGKGDDQPKYLNSQETPVFSKRRILYGIDVARDSIRRSERAVVVEGYMDVVTCHQYGFTNVVASLGTSLTRDQAQLLARYAPEVVILYDADVAGQDATLRGLELLRSEGLRVKVVTLEEGEDPDSFLRANGASKLKALLESAKNLTEYRIDSVVKNTDLRDASLKAEASRQCIAILVEVSDPIERLEYSKYAAYQLMVDEDVFLRQVDAASQRDRHAWDTLPKTRYTKQVKSAGQAGPGIDRRTEPQAPGAEQPLAEKLTKAELLLLSMVLDDPDLTALVDDRLCEESFSHESAYRIYQLVRECAGQARGEQLHSRLLARVDDEAMKQLIHRLSVDAGGVAADPKRTVVDCALHMEDARLGRKIADLESQLRESEREGDIDRSLRLRKEIMDYQRFRQETRARMSNPNAYRS